MQDNIGRALDQEAEAHVCKSGETYAFDKTEIARETRMQCLELATKGVEMPADYPHEVLKVAVAFAEFVLEGILPTQSEQEGHPDPLANPVAQAPEPEHHDAPEAPEETSQPLIPRHDEPQSDNPAEPGPEAVPETVEKEELQAAA